MIKGWIPEFQPFLAMFGLELLALGKLALPLLPSTRAAMPIVMMHALSTGKTTRGDTSGTRSEGAISAVAT